MAHFFGLTAENRFEIDEESAGYEQKIFEEIFQLNYYGDLSLTECWNLPIGLRRWFLKRLAKEKEEEKKRTQSNQNKRELGS